MSAATLGRVILLLIKWTSIAMGLLFLAGSLISAHFTQKFLRTSMTAEGRVVGLKPVRGGRHNSLTYAPVFRFDVPGTHFATVVSNTSSSPPAFKVGEVVTVHYQQGHPEKAVIDSFEQLWLGDLVFGVVGAMSCGMGLLMTILARRLSRQAPVAPDSGSGITRF